MTGWNGGRWAAFGALLAFSSPISVQPATAAWSGTDWGRIVSLGPNARVVQTNSASPYSGSGRGYSVARYGRIGGPLQCVPFARANSGIELTGNAATWWGSAAGVYERGNRPEVGSVLNFRANGRMRLGHVAVVSRVIDSRNVEIDHANWAYPGGISRNIDVVDVSPRNDWTAVRVALGQSKEFGSIYPTYGFIYDRPDRGTMVANADIAPTPVLNPPPSDLRPASERVAASPGGAEEEVAEAADDAQPRMRRAAYARTRVGKANNGTAASRVGARTQPTAKVSHRRHAPSNM